MSRSLIKSVRTAAATGIGAIRRKLVYANHSALQAAPLPLYSGAALSPAPTPTPAPLFISTPPAAADVSTSEWLASLGAEHRLAHGNNSNVGQYSAPTPASVYVAPGLSAPAFSEKG